LSNCLKNILYNNKNTKGVNIMNKLFAALIAGFFVLSATNIPAQGYGYGRGFGERDGFRDRDRIHEKLNLSEEQKSKIEDLKIDHRREMIELKSELEIKELELQELRVKGNYTRDEYIAKVTELGEIRNKMNLAKANHQMDIYALLDNSQKEIWNEMQKILPRIRDRYREQRQPFGID
jgi:Spy/CpxP family protein refolding chaperone